MPGQRRSGAKAGRTGRWAALAFALAAASFASCRGAEGGAAPATGGGGEGGEPIEKKPPAPIQYGEGKRIAHLANGAIDESSGLAASRCNPGVFWTHNDSGGRPRLYAFNRKGESLGVFDVRAGAIDWDDMAAVKIKETSYLLAADVGDNFSLRGQYALYWLEEPEVAEEEKPAVPRRLDAEAIPFVYEDGSHNCEAAAVDPATGAIYLVSKRKAATCKVYTLPGPLAEGWPEDGYTAGEPARAVAVATLRIPTVTAMDISPDGRRALVGTYADAYEYARAEDETWPEAFGREGRRLAMPARRKGEGISYGPDGRAIYLTSEYAPCPLFEVPVLENKADGKDE